MEKLRHCLAIVVIIGLSSSCDMARKFEERARVVNNYEKAALELARENRLQKAKIIDLEFEIDTLKSQNKFLEMQVAKKSPDRSLASLAPVDPQNDLVKFEIYKWKAEQMLAVAQNEFDKKSYEKSAQFFRTYQKRYGRQKVPSDRLLFQSGLAAYESGKHHDWAVEDFTHLIDKYPTSSYYKGAKLWIAMAKLKQGHEKEFFQTVEEFRKKYRNTPEWEILSAHYEKILHKYKD